MFNILERYIHIRKSSNVKDKINWRISGLIIDSKFQECDNFS